MRLVLFDVDGTLVDAGGAGRWALDRAFEDIFEIARMDSRAARIRFDGRTDPLIISDMAAAAGIPKAVLAEKRARIESRYLARLEERLSTERKARALPGVTDLLRGLRDRGARVGLLTGNIERGAMLKLRASGIEDSFEGGAFGSDADDRASLGRLARERFESCLGERIAEREVVVIGDSPEDVRSARANGYRCLAVETGWTPAEALAAERPDRMVRDLSDTPTILAWILGPN